MGAPAIPRLMSALKSWDPETREYASQALLQIGRPSVPPLVQALRKGNGDPRRRSAFLLREIGDPAAVDPLIAALKDRNWNVRNEAA
jgi:bilin biosynthesis protein